MRRDAPRAHHRGLDHEPDIPGRKHRAMHVEVARNRLDMLDAGAAVAKYFASARSRARPVRGKGNAHLSLEQLSCVTSFQPGERTQAKIGRASCRERVEISGVAVTL